MSGGPSLPSSPSSYASPYQPPNQGQAASGALGGANTIANTNPNGLYNSAGSTTTGNNLTQQGGALAGQAQAALAPTAFNPAQYAQQYQQQQDQTNATLSQQGVAGTPYGAGLAAQQNQNFNNNWNTQQVGLENTAANTASTLLGAGGNAATTGTALGQSVATLPQQQLQTAIQDYLSYLGQGTSASNAATSQYGAESSAALGQQQVNNSALGGLGSALGSLFGGAGGLSGVGSGLASLGTLFL